MLQIRRFLSLIIVMLVLHGASALCKPVRVEMLRAAGNLDAGYRDGNLVLQIQLKNYSATTAAVVVDAELRDPHGGTITATATRSFELPAGAAKSFTMKKVVERPAKWTAETPALYSLTLRLTVDGKLESTVRRKVAFRKIEVDGVSLIVNGVHVKPRGVDLRQIPVVRDGTLAGEDLARDIRMMKKANINTVRTSHYPPPPEFLELCDRYGLYVVGEMSFGSGDELLRFPNFRPLPEKRVRATYTHVIFGSDGIVDEDRTPQPEFYEVKKTYTPLFITDREIAVRPGQAKITINLENRYDFTNLHGMKYYWKLLRDYDEINNGTGQYGWIPPHATGTQTLDLDFPARVYIGSVYVLRIVTYDSGGVNTDVTQLRLVPKIDIGAALTFDKEYSISPMPPPARAKIANNMKATRELRISLNVYRKDRLIAEKQLDFAAAPGAGNTIRFENWWKQMPVLPMYGEISAELDVCAKDGYCAVATAVYHQARKLKIFRKESYVIVRNESFDVRLDTRTGLIYAFRAGDMFDRISGPELNAWRPPHVVELTPPSFESYPMFPLHEDLEPKAEGFSIKQHTDESVVIESRVRYADADNPSGYFIVNYKYNILCSGEVDVEYVIEPAIGEQKLLELGVRFRFPPYYDKLTVTGRGPDTYPHSIKGTETSFLGKMRLIAGASWFESNKTEVSRVDLDGGKTKIRFEPGAPDKKRDSNTRADHNSEETILYFNPWVQSPTMAKSERRPGYAIVVRDGEKFHGEIKVRFLVD